MGVAEGIGGLGHQRQRLFQPHDLVELGQLAQVRAQAEALDQFHDDVEQIDLAAEVVDADDGQVVEPGGGARLLQKAGLEGGVGGQIAVHHLDRHRAHQVHVCGAVDGAHPPFAQDGIDAVVLDLLAGLEHGGII